MANTTKMRIITINVPENYLEAIRKLVGVLYPSRSELIRVALREFLIRELEFMHKLPEWNELLGLEVNKEEIKMGRPIDIHTPHNLPIMEKEHKSQFQTDFEVIETPLETQKYIEEML